MGKYEKINATDWKRGETTILTSSKGSKIQPPTHMSKSKAEKLWFKEGATCWNYVLAPSSWTLELPGHMANHGGESKVESSSVQDALTHEVFVRAAVC